MVGCVICFIRKYIMCFKYDNIFVVVDEFVGGCDVRDVGIDDGYICFEIVVEGVKFGVLIVGDFVDLNWVGGFWGLYCVLRVWVGNSGYGCGEGKFVDLRVVREELEFCWGVVGGGWGGICLRWNSCVYIGGCEGCC